MRDLTFKFHCVTSSGSSAGCLFKCFCEFMHVVGKQLEGGARYRLLQSRRWLATSGQRQFIQWFYCLQTTHSALLSDSAVGVVRKYLMFAIKSILSLYVVC